MKRHRLHGSTARYQAGAERTTGRKIPNAEAQQGEKPTETDQRLPIPSLPLVTAQGDISPSPTGGQDH